jgi:peptidoglycan/xylan/chitin deacetylase (PgdA/CDA1 family)
MFLTSRQYYGNHLKEKTLCLTFDDGPGETSGYGPGPKTLQLAHLLYSYNVRATFFMVGRFIEQFKKIPPQVAALGHLIGNHTYSHSGSLPDLLSSGSDIVSEIEKTDHLIKDLNPSGKVYFRAPWGQWSAAVANNLNSGISSSIDHIGPFSWDIGGDDWALWRDGLSPEGCASLYLQEIFLKKKGIILMHDSTADNDHIMANNRTFETVAILLPQLINSGYKFVRLDEISS